MITEFWQEERAQDLIEYSLLLGAIALAAAGTYLSIGSDVNTLWQVVNQRFDDASK